MRRLHSQRLNNNDDGTTRQDTTRESDFMVTPERRTRVRTRASCRIVQFTVPFSSQGSRQMFEYTVHHILCTVMYDTVPF